MQPAPEPKKSSRILTYDLMRGYFLVAIILNHLYWYPNGLDWVAARGELFVSAAEGFFLLSGIILGIVRGRKLLNKPFNIAAKLLVQRSVQLYITSIVLMLLFTLLGWWFFIDNPGLKPGIRPTSQPFIDVLFGALTYEYIYGWADFLRLYAIFILFAPLALWLLRRGKAYIVLLLSILVYATLPLFQEFTRYSDELLMPVTWQVIFFGGFVIGFYTKQISARWQAIASHHQRYIKTAIYTIAGLTVSANIVIAFGGAASDTLLYIRLGLEPYFNKEALPPPRIILFSIWFLASFWLFQKFEPQIMKFFGWILLPFGANSLYVYTVHAFVIFFVHMIMKDASSNILINIIGTLAVLMIIWLALRYKVLAKIIPR